MKLLIIVSLILLNSISGKCSEFVNLVKKVSKKEGVSSDIMLAIAHIESTTGSNKQTNYNTNGTKDVGPFQINSVHHNVTCKQYNVYTLYGNTVCAAKLLKIAQKHASTDPFWVGRYHSRTKKLKLQYYKKVIEYINNKPNQGTIK